MPEPAPVGYDVAAEFAAALAAAGLPPSATLADLVRHERGQMGMQVAFDLMAQLELSASRLEGAGDAAAAAALRDAVRSGTPGLVGRGPAVEALVDAALAASLALANAGSRDLEQVLLDAIADVRGVW